MAKYIVRRDVVESIQVDAETEEKAIEKALNAPIFDWGSKCEAIDAERVEK